MDMDIFKTLSLSLSNLSIKTSKILIFLILVLIFTLYLVAKRFHMIPEFRDSNPSFDTVRVKADTLEKIAVVILSGIGYSMGIHVYWIAAFLLLYMSVVLLWKPTPYSGKGGSSIQVIHEYDMRPEKRDVQRKKAVIPLHIYQTWHTKKLPPKMKACIEKLKRENPDFTHHLFDDEDCRKYIETHFDKEVLVAYDTLIPGAYKADLWRYCVLYKDGGIYMDIKLQCEPNFRLLELVDKEHFVLDRPHIKRISLADELAWIQSPHYSTSVYENVDSNIWENGTLGLYNAFMVCKPNNPVLKKCIDKIVDNTKKKTYGYGQLYPTGPGLLGALYFGRDREKIHKIDLYNSLNGDCILSKNKKILSHYPEYRSEQTQSGTPHYNDLWNKKQVYL